MSVVRRNDWCTPRAFLLPELGPGVAGDLRVALEQALRCITADPSVKGLVLFGSRASGSARPDSDLDLLVVERVPHLDPQATAACWWRHRQPLLPLPVAVALVVSGSADAERLSGSRWHVISEAARHGQVLVVQP
ncbi:MAG: nucleotidyltransferase domain-containing protein [Cyanobium sp.]